MRDLISRKGAIDYIKTQRGRPFIGITLEEAIIMMIEEVPSAQPELIEKAAYIRGFEQGRTQGIIDSQGGKKGEWIDYSDEGYVECPFCHSATNCDGNKDELHFCFSCGAELR